MSAMRPGGALSGRPIRLGQRSPCQGASIGATKPQDHPLIEIEMMSEETGLPHLAVGLRGLSSSAIPSLKWSMKPSQRITCLESISYHAASRFLAGDRHVLFPWTRKALPAEAVCI
jgi:hypothetical protein